MRMKLTQLTVAVPLSMAGQKMGFVEAERQRLAGGEGAVDVEGSWGVAVPPSSSSLFSHHASEGEKKAKYVLGKLPATADHTDVSLCVLVVGD